MATVHQIAQKGFGSGTNELYDRYVYGLHRKRAIVLSILDTNTELAHPTSLLRSRASEMP